MKDEYYGKIITHEQFSKSYPENLNVNDHNVLNSVQVPIGKSFLDDDEFWSLPPDVLITDDGDYAVYENGELVVIQEGYKEEHQRTLILK